MSRRVLLAFAVAPAVAPLGAVAWALAGGVGVRESIVIGSIYAAFTYGAAIVFGVPAFMLFERRGWTRLWQYMAVGVVTGAVVMAAVWSRSGQRSIDVRTILLGVAIGAASTTVFWWIAGPREIAKYRAGTYG